MRQIFINNMPAYPETGQAVKLTIGNPLFEDSSGSYTLEMSFPMNILANRQLFGNITRKDVTKNYRSMSGRIMIDNRLLLNGTAIVTEVTEDSVKVQLLGGRSEMKYVAERDNTYIDKMDLQPKLSEGIYDDIFQYEGYHGDDLVEGFVAMVTGDSEEYQHRYRIATPNIIGFAGLFNFMPVRDATSDNVKNQVRLQNDYGTVTNNIWAWPNAVQPNLWWITQRIFLRLGYTISRCDIPQWLRDDVYIASSRQTISVADALPHWTVSQFIEELEKLFNVTIAINEREKTVNIFHMGDMDSWEEIGEIIDEHKATVIATSEVDANRETSNLNYTRSPQHTWDLVDEEVMRSFKHVTDEQAAGIEDINQDFLSMSEEERAVTVITSRGYQWVWVEEESSAHQVNHLGALIRDAEDENFVELKICPAAFGDAVYSYHASGSVNAPIMEVENAYADPEVTTAWGSINENAVDTGTEKEDRMEIYMVPANRYRVNNNTDLPMAMTDGYLADILTDGGVFEQKSLSLRELYLMDSIGMLHVEGMTLNKNSEQMFSFIRSTIPDVTAGFRIGNKQWLCKKIEVNVTEQGQDQLMTGYFIEITS